MLLAGDTTPKVEIIDYMLALVGLAKTGEITLNLNGLMEAEQ